LSLHDDIGDLGAVALAEAPNLAGLTYLDVRCWIGPEGVRALAASPYLRHLKSLDLHVSGMGDEGADALARSPILAEVENLRLVLDELSDEGARALAASPYLARLNPGGLYLWITSGLTEAGWQALRARFGDRIWDKEKSKVREIGPA
jgi:hypothetical protein